ncbi:MAG: type I restriction-modification system subunit M [Xanthomonadales bacterium]|jgi:type I restriction enzyme M protein|nr:type I restriction-modification system subunit M [Xanthomonadales bacterium]
MPLKKSDLYSSLWASCDELRGGMDASQYKDYVLFLLFIKYISDKYADSQDFAPPVVIPRGASFSDMLALRGKPDIGDRINTQVIGPLVQANSRLARTDFPDFNDSNKLGEGRDKVDRLTNLINIFARPQLDFSQNRAEHDDILGDAYEYLMRHFATESGKSKGQFYTPAEVSRIIAKVIGISPQNTRAATTAYDPTCGSGSLLLKVAAEAGKHITLEGQEKDVTTAGLARMNLILHDFPTANIQAGNTLAAPKFKDAAGHLRTYDYVVANPPFSDKTWSTGLTPEADPYQRFAWGAPPPKQGDYAYLLHLIRSMKSSGKGACILPHGVLFRGGAEAQIRKQLVRSGILKGIIGLPANLFYGTGIPACILVLDKDNAAARKGVFLIDASKGYRKDGPKNRLREQDLHRIVDTFTRQTEVPRYARMVPLDEIASPANDYNLNLPRYIDTSEPEDLQDIEAHLRGGIPERDLDTADSALAPYWQVLPGLRQALFSPLPPGEGPGVRAKATPPRPGYVHLQPPLTELKATILGHPEFSAFQQQATQRFADWRAVATQQLKAYGQNQHPKALIETLAEDLLAAFEPVPLVDAYDIYQHLMDYWAETMQDDAYLIAADGWVAKPARVLETDKKGKQKDKGWACDLIPKPLIVARYYAAEQATLDSLQAAVDAAHASLAELEEEHSGEDAAFAGFDNITAAAVKERIREIGRDPAGAEELAVLRAWLELSGQITDSKRQLRELEATLDRLAYQHYATLSTDDIQTLVIDDKWMAHLHTAVQAELARVSQTLTTRLRQLAERYATPLPSLVDEVEGLAGRVAGHLRRMGIEIS